MKQSHSFGAVMFFVVMMLVGAYFIHAAIYGPSGVLQRMQIMAETRELVAERDRLQAEVDRLRNLTRRLSDHYLDLDLLDERARAMLGVLRPDEVVIR
ncbi:septum formation initiator family protein [Paracoccus kondratievae]|uniref:Septum formation initiator n=1 Tax=Paracoccus kondratievae TaxID=135740 RepID=A0AAD3RT87_9RHOB|nr:MULTISPECIES: septum formation initiator family protein [Paracoccus]QFQ86852.1 septum formation initiator family protein [Paracoccus kondratievae]GLK63555.1 septum formation initiator [Paracoccus kondratievae]SMG30119.1 Cell division protein FtsB [Paracoccus sp. J56]